MAESLHDHIWAPSPSFNQGERDFMKDEIGRVGEVSIRALVSEAVACRPNAYSPYFKYAVGASVLTVEGGVTAGCNFENIAASPTTHAEYIAIVLGGMRMIDKTNRRFIRALAVVHNGDSGPCGECLQRIVEHADDCLIITADPEGKIRRITSLKAIFPYNFNPSHLGF